MQLAPYESGCELTNCKGCEACWRSPKAILQDVTRGAAPKTKQGVPNLDAMLGTKGAQGHQHRYAPVTFTNRSRVQVTVMKCYCGVVRAETETERSMRESLHECDMEDGGW